MAGGAVRCGVPCSDRVWHVVLSPLSLACPTPHCVCCHSIVGLVWCLCDRVVSLWDSGDGLCVGWNGGGGWCVRLCFSPSSSSFPLPLPSSLVGVRGSARAAMRARTLSPNTIMFSLPIVCSSSPPPSSSSSAPRLSSACWNGGGGGHHVFECSVGMTAMGSLSRSSSFFW